MSCERAKLSSASSTCANRKRGKGVKGALYAEVKRLRISYNQNDETLSRNSLRYLSKANLTIAVDCSCREYL